VSTHLEYLTRLPLPNDPLHTRNGILVRGNEGVIARVTAQREGVTKHAHPAIIVHTTIQRVQ